jgi:release factor glutamine methyltransferase
MPTQLRHYLADVAQQLTRAGVDNPALCARLLAGHALGYDSLRCVLNANQELTPSQLTALNELTSRRATGEPMAHILGCREFYGRSFFVTPQTLIPRPETELLVETALARLTARPLHFADMGTGCGCIGITLALERPRWKGVLADNSAPALAVAKDNARALNAAQRLACVLADMRAAPLATNAFDLLVSNPPYIRECDRALVMDEVLRFEPRTALFSPDNGLAHLRAVCGLAAKCLKDGGLLLLEHSAEQGEQVRNLLAETGIFENIGTSRDLAGLERCTSGKKLA